MGTKLHLDPATEKRGLDTAVPEVHRAAEPDSRRAAPAVRTHADMGAEQGGLLDWFRSKFGRKRRPETPLNISAPMGLEKNTSEESAAYMKAMDPLLRKERIAHLNTTAPVIGKGGGAAAAQAFGAALRGDGGGMNYLQNSNAGLADSRSTALVNLGIRTSGDAPSQAEKNMRGSIYDGLANDYSSLLFDMQSSGVDADDMLAKGEITSTMVTKADGEEDKLGYAAGAGFDELNNKALDLFSGYVLSDESLRYLRDFSAGVAPAEVFGGQMRGLNGASGFALQTLVNTVGGNVAKLATDQRLSGASRRVGVNMGRTIGSLPKMASVPEENLPESLRPLRARYIALQEEMDRRLAELQ